MIFYYYKPVLFRIINQSIVVTSNSTATVNYCIMNFTKQCMSSQFTLQIKINTELYVIVRKQLCIIFVKILVCFKLNK